VTEAIRRWSAHGLNLQQDTMSVEVLDCCLFWFSIRWRDDSPGRGGEGKRRIGVAGAGVAEMREVWYHRGCLQGRILCKSDQLLQHIRLADPATSATTVHHSVRHGRISSKQPS
jgi:hypothetical protein